jgi:type I restriction enzyme, S subunit
MKKRWTRKALADVCQIRPPKSEARARLAPEALVSFAPMEDLGIDRKQLRATQTKPLSAVLGSYTYFSEGDVLLAKITPCFENGKVGIASELTSGVGFGSSEFIVLRPCSELDKEYLYYFLSTPDFRARGAERMTGAVGQKRVSKEFIENCLIPIPPLPEQRRIVGILDEAFDGIAVAKANAEKNLQNARALFESHLNAVFSQRGEGWVEKRLAEVVHRLTNGYVGPTRNIYHDTGVPYLLARHVRNNRLTFDGKTFVSEEFNQKHKKSMLKANDVLLVQSGHIGHSAVVPKSHEGHNCHAMIVITPVTTCLNGPFLSLCFNSTRMQEVFGQIRSGSTVPHLTCREVREVLVPIPDLATQQKIVDSSRRLEAETQHLQSIYQRKLAALDELKKSLLDQAFSGAL